MKCPNCGNENENQAKFCRNCGEKLKGNITKVDAKDKDKKIIIALIVVAAILLVSVIAFATGIINTGPELKTKEFDGFKLDVPVGSDFVLSESHTTDPKNIFVGYINNGKYSMDAFGFQVGTNLNSKILKNIGTLEKSDGDLKVYKNESDGDAYYIVFKKGDKANIAIFGDNLNTIKDMANSFEDKKFSKLAKNSS